MRSNLSIIWVNIKSSEEGDEIASALAKSRCFMQEETRLEALEMICDAIRGYIVTLQKHGEGLPKGFIEAEFLEIDVKTDL